MEWSGVEWSGVEWSGVEWTNDVLDLLWGGNDEGAERKDDDGIAGGLEEGFKFVIEGMTWKSVKDHGSDHLNGGRKFSCHLQRRGRSRDDQLSFEIIKRMIWNLDSKLRPWLLVFVSFRFVSFRFISFHWA